MGNGGLNDKVCSVTSGGTTVTTVSKVLIISEYCIEPVSQILPYITRVSYRTRKM